MGKFIVRITIVLVSIYFLISFLLAQRYGIDILNDYHTILFELCVVVYCFSEGKYHCKFLKSTALAILLSDSISRLDNSFNFLSIDAHNYICAYILALGIATSITLALHHFYKVSKLRNKRKKINGN